MTEAPAPAADDRIAAGLSERARSMGEMFLRQVENSEHREAFRYRDAAEQWQSLSWGQTKDRVFDLAAGLLALGLEPEERVSIASTTRLEWILADLAVMCAGGAVTTVYPTTNSEDVGYIVSDSGVVIAIVEDAEQLAKLREAGDVFAGLRAVIIMDGDDPAESVYTFDELAALGREHLQNNPDAVTDAIAATGPDSLATLIYTSGTTGRPKGVALTHDAWAYEGRAVDMIDLLRPSDVQFLWLPLSHVFGKALMALQLQIGFVTAVDGRVEKIVDGLGEVKPTWMAGAPRIFEKVRARVMIGAQGGLKGKIANWAFAVGERAAPYRLAGKPLPRALAIQHRLADKLVFSKLKDRMGGQMRFMVSGSAKLSKQVQDWFYAAGLLIIEGYGLTETSAVTFVNDPRRPRFGTVGPPVPGTDVKIAEDGEVLLRGPGVSRGYHNRDEANAESFVDGWFHTGDIGEVDAEGYLRITDRKKDLIKTSNGKYVAPQRVEGAVVANCPYISQAVVVGEGRNYVTALIALDPDAITGWGEANELGGLSAQELARHEKVYALIDSHIARANEHLDRWETVKRFVILDAELSVDSGEMTPSMKIRRQAVVSKYQPQLDKLYDAVD